jgi:lambda family phage portal protein
MAQVMSNLAGENLQASEGIPPSSSDIGSTAGLVIDTAHRGASQNDRSMLRWAVSAPVDPNLETIYDLPPLRARSRDLARNNPIAHGAIGLPVRNIVGPGLTLHPRLNRQFLGLSDEEGDAWETNTKTLWDFWAKYSDADVRSTENFYILQSLAFLSVLVSGEIFVLMPMVSRPGTVCDLRIQLVEGDRVSNPQLTFDTLDRMGGIEVDIWGAPTAYWIETTPTWLNVQRTWERVEAFGKKSGRRNVFHLYDQQRPGDRRGVPYLSPVIQTLKQISRYSEAELMAAVVAAMFTVFVTSETGEDSIVGQALPTPVIPGTTNPVGAGDGTASANGPNAIQGITLGNGAIVGLSPSEKIEIADPKRPNAQYEPYVNAHLRHIGMSLGIPYEVLCQHFSSSYSASRASLLEAWRFYDERRIWFATRFCQPIYEEWLAQMVAEGRIAAPGFFDSVEVQRAFASAEWIGASPGMLDPVRETNAAQMRISAGLSTFERETRTLTGGNWDHNFQQRAKEEKRRRELGLEFTTEINPVSGDDEDDDNDDETKGEEGKGSVSKE